MVFFTGLLIFILPFSSFTNQSKIVLYDIESGPNSPATTPQNKEVDVISIYSDSFTNVPNTNFYANWNQKTNVSEVSIDGNKNSIEISDKIVDSIEAGKLEQAKGEIFDGIKEKAAEVVDMKRVEQSVNWMDKNTTTGEVEK